jgi:hypothetical protein
VENFKTDGLNERWESGVPSDWEGEMGEHDDEYIVCQYALPNAISNLRTPAEVRGYDISGMGTHSPYAENGADDEIGNHNNSDDMETEDTGANDMETDDTGAVRAVRVVRNLSQEYFRKRLVQHFDICWRRNDLVWPQRTRVTEPPTYE